MEPGSEIELKLSVRPDDLARVARARLLKPPGARRGATRRLESTYYDTPDLALRARNLVLRVRKIGQRYVQTVKSRAAGGSGLMNRREVEAPVEGAKPDLSKVADQELRQALDAAASALGPAFTTEIKRTTRMIESGSDASVELAIDQGEVVTARGSEPVCEIELELKQGKPAALYDFALALNDIAPVHLETRSKSDRGYALLAGGDIGWSKAGTVRLDPAMTGAEAFEAIIRHNLGHLIANEPVAREGSEPEGVHQLRLALRRLRSALVVFRPVLPDGLRQQLKDELKWLAGELGPARNLDVFLGALLVPVKTAFPDEADLVHLEAIAEEARREAYRAVAAAFATARYTRLLLQLGRLLEVSAWREELDAEAAMRFDAPVRRLAAEFVAKRHRKACKRGRHFVRLSAEERHKLRIALKRLRYSADFFRSLYDKEATAPYLKRLSKLQDDLGDLNDVETATELLQQFEERAVPGGDEALHHAAGLVAGWHRRGEAAIGPGLRKKWRRFKAEAPFWTEDHA